MEYPILDFTEKDHKKLQKIYNIEYKNSKFGISYIMFCGVFVIILGIIFISVFSSSQSDSSTQILFSVFIGIFLILPGIFLIYLSLNQNKKILKDLKEKKKEIITGKIEFKHEIPGRYTKHVFIIKSREIIVDSSTFSEYKEGMNITIELALHSKNILNAYITE